MSDLSALRTLREAALGLARKTTSGRMGLGQLQAILDPAVLPSAWREEVASELATFAVRPDPLGAKDVEKLLRAAWDEKLADVLDDFDTAPFAVTVGAQVHRGECDGRAVVVKILKPGLAELVRADLKLAEALTGPARMALPKSDPGAVLRELTQRVMDELDLEHEGAAQRSIGRALRGVDGVVVPAPLTALTHPTVLVREYFDGTPLSTADAPADREVVARALLGAALAAARAGTVHCDPEPANVLLRADGTVGLIDAGASTTIAPERLARAADALQALVDADGDAFAAALAALGWVTGHDDAVRVLELGRELGAPLLHGPVTLDRELLGRLADIAWERVEDVADLTGAVTVIPVDLWPLRGAAGLALSLAKLGATLDWPRVAIEELRA